MKPRLTLEEYHQGILQGNRIVLAQAITLIESSLKEDQQLGDQLLDAIIPKTGKSIRIGITGVPGVGKSTFIEALGKHITASNKNLAVLTVDPSSPLTKGSILGDKTRMEALSTHPNAFIRPSSTGVALGGVTHRTRETILLCEAAGFDVIIVETVGVGQSEVQVKNMVDFFLLLMLAGAGDELQGIKKGIIEMADTLVITKADGDNKQKAKDAQQEYQHALHLLPSPENKWHPKVITCSATQNEGITEVWGLIENYITVTQASNYFLKNRESQRVNWLSEKFNELVQSHFQGSQHLSITLHDLEEKVRNEEIAVNHAAQHLLEVYHQSIRETNPETKK